MAAAISQADTNSSKLWHSRMGHPSSKALELFNFSDFSTGVFDSKTFEVCIRAKQTRDSFLLSSNKTMVFELVHCDLWGPYITTSICGSKYFLTILDNYSRAVWVYLLPSMQEAPKHLRDFIALVERQFNI